MRSSVTPFFFLLASFVFLFIFLHCVEGLVCVFKDCYKNKTCDISEYDCKLCEHKRRSGRACAVHINLDADALIEGRRCIDKTMCGTEVSSPSHRWQCCTGDYCNNGTIAKNEGANATEYPWITVNMTCKLNVTLTDQNKWKYEEDESSEECAFKDKLNATCPERPEEKPGAGASRRHGKGTWTTTVVLAFVIVILTVFV